MNRSGLLSLTRTVLILFMFAFALVQVWSATYYVSKSGLDANPGTLSQPWLTIQKAADVMDAGDTAIVSSGTYLEEVDSKRDGTAGAEIVFKVASGDTVTLLQWDIEHSYIRIEGFNFRGYSGYPNLGIVEFGPLAQYSKCIDCTFDDGASGRRGYGVQFLYAGGNSPDNCTVKGCTFMNFSGDNTYGVLFYMTGNNHTIEDNEILNCKELDLFVPYGSGHVIKNNYVHDITDDPVYGVHVDIFQVATGELARDMTIENNMFINIEGAVCQINDDGSTLARDWTFDKNLFANISNKASIAIRSYWYNNIFYSSGHTASGGNAHIMYFVKGGTGDSSGSILKNNIFIGNGYTPGDPTLGWYAVSSSMTIDYNFVSSDAANSYSAKTGFTEPNGLNGGNPLFVNPGNPVGADGKMWTSDDGFVLQAGSPLRGAGEGGADFGPYGDYDPVDPPASNPDPPSGLRITS